MKQLYSTIVLLFLSSLAVLAQPRVQLSTRNVSLGSVLWKNTTIAKFSVKNAGNRDLHILQARTSCGCTSVEFPRQGIAPGKSAEISVTFVGDLLGHFSKSIGIYTDASNQPEYVNIEGVVVSHKEDYSKDYPFHTGEIYLNTDVVEFDNVRHGDYPTSTILVFNGGKQSYTPQLMHLPKYISAISEPEIIRPGRTGKITLTLNSESLDAMGLTQTSIYLSRYAGDRVSRNNEISVSITKLPEVQTQDPALAPKAEIDNHICLVGKLAQKNKLVGQLTLKNTGHSNLEVSKLQVYNPGISVSLGKSILAPGQSTILRIVCTANSEYFKGRRRILLITNDPEQSQILIDVEVDTSGTKEETSNNPDKKQKRTIKGVVSGLLRK